MLKYINSQLSQASGEYRTIYILGVGKINKTYIFEDWVKRYNISNLYIFTAKEILEKIDGFYCIFSEILLSNKKSKLNLYLNSEKRISTCFNKDKNDIYVIYTYVREKKLTDFRIIDFYKYDLNLTVDDLTFREKRFIKDFLSEKSGLLGQDITFGVFL